MCLIMRKYGSSHSHGFGVPTSTLNKTRSFLSTLVIRQVNTCSCYVVVDGGTFASMEHNTYLQHCGLFQNQIRPNRSLCSGNMSVKLT